MPPEQYDFTIRNLGARKIRSSVSVSYYTPDDKRMLFNSYLKHFERTFVEKKGTPLCLEVAGPREFSLFRSLEDEGGHRDMRGALSRHQTM